MKLIHYCFELRVVGIDLIVNQFHFYFRRRYAIRYQGIIRT